MATIRLHDVTKIFTAADAALIARTSSRFSPSEERAVRAIWTSLRDPLGKRGRKGFLGAAFGEHDPGQATRRPARRVNLGAMVRLVDVDVAVGQAAEPSRGRLDYAEEKIYADREIGGVKNRRVALGDGPLDLAEPVDAP